MEGGERQNTSAGGVTPQVSSRYDGPLIAGGGGGEREIIWKVNPGRREGGKTGTEHFGRWRNPTLSPANP